MDRRAPRAATLCLGAAALVGGCGGANDGDRPEPPKIPTQAQQQAAGQEPVTVDKPAYRARLADANEAHNQRLAKLAPGANETPSPKDRADLLRGFADSVAQLSADLKGFRPRDADAAAAHEKLIEGFTSTAAFVDANLGAVEKEGFQVLKQGALEQQGDRLVRARDDATATLVKSGWAPKDIEFDT